MDPGDQTIASDRSLNPSRTVEHPVPKNPSSIPYTKFERRRKCRTDALPRVLSLFEYQNTHRVSARKHLYLYLPEIFARHLEKISRAVVAARSRLVPFGETCILKRMLVLRASVGTMEFHARTDRNTSSPPPGTRREPSKKRFAASGRAFASRAKYFYQSERRAYLCPRRREIFHRPLRATTARKRALLTVLMNPRK